MSLWLIILFVIVSGLGASFLTILEIRKHLIILGMYPVFLAHLNKGLGSVSFEVAVTTGYKDKFLRDVKRFNSNKVKQIEMYECQCAGCKAERAE